MFRPAFPGYYFVCYLLPPSEGRVCDSEPEEERFVFAGLEEEEERVVLVLRVTWALVLRCSPLWRLYC
mgnify:CR=1 FL=1